MITYKIHLLRTGSTGDGGAKKFVGQTDAKLSSTGVEALERLLLEKKYPDAAMVFTSPLVRCTQTAGILYPGVLSERLGGLRDMDLGVFSGKTFEELRGDADFSRWIQNSRENPPPEGESLSCFLERITAAFTEIFSRMMSERLTEAAVITHSGVIMTLLSAIGLPKRPVNEWAVENGCGYTLLFTPQLWMQGGAVEVYRAIPAACTTNDYDLSD